ncbi:protein-disulfide reductase DsbD [Undibacterium macrobrachii]|uniref:Thiol:disulfide interchange protein DsbD n=1 Tax=Undibacterium macrobrachii TaxID=1119058 RepID=A0ABQ2XQ09_9BURK|nr:protein-disulfide reductase DsbD [Undibacterium macrobrachii]GGX26370.1 thiol:disulfide interchange protein DsbD [Undibacterium macrobrachii]
MTFIGSFDFLLRIRFLFERSYLLGISLVLCLITSGSLHAEDFLAPELAFKVKAQMVSANQMAVRFDIADGYYLYRDQFKFEAKGAELGAFEIPPGKVKFDETFQKDVESYYRELTVLIPVDAKSDFQALIRLQGCADAGLCYPPMDLVLPVSLAEIAPLPASKVLPMDSVSSGEQSSIAEALKSGRLALIIPLFILLGLGLSLTPCVLPMVPILSYIIVGEGAGIKRSRAFFLSLSYVLGMALVYTALGVAAGLLGEGLSASLQNPWVLSAFALFMAILSLSMFGIYQLQMPVAIQTKLTYFSEGQRNGKMLGVFLMGAVSALIVGPCVAAPLAGALVYISQTKDVVVGGAALFAMAIGMGVPLLLVGISAGSLLPRAGVWMEQIKRFFGVLMLAMAIWMVSPVIPALYQMLAWSLLLLTYGAYQLFVYKGRVFSKFLAMLFILGGAAQLIGLITGGRDPLSPVAHLTGNVVHVQFQRVKTTAELDTILAQSREKLVMLDFYADWCISCKEMEKLTFVEPRVKAKLDQMLLLQVDVTKNDSDDKAMLKRFGLFGPPGIIFFDRAGQEILGKRVIGYQNAEKFLHSLQQLESKN